MRSIQPLLDAKVLQRTVIFDKDGFAVDYHWELV
jgi:hypothetical protein